MPISKEQSQIDQLATMFGQALGMMASPTPPSMHTLEHFVSFHEASSTTIADKRMFEYIRYGMEAMLSSLRKAEVIPQDYIKEILSSRSSKTDCDNHNTNDENDNNEHD